jgi:hypothetical protein
MHYAQTNIQLYNQLCAAGWNEADLRHVHSAYELTMHLFAGLLHSAYMSGEFGDGLHGISEFKRRLLRRTVGSACEEVVANYTSFSWHVKNLHSLLAGERRLSPIEEIVVLIKLADTLEDFLDRGADYAPHRQRGSMKGTDVTWRQSVVDVAKLLGHHALAEQLAEAMFTEHSPAIPDFLRANEPGSFLVAPNAYRMRTTVKLGRAYRKLRAKLRIVSPTTHREAA